VDISLQALQKLLARNPAVPKFCLSLACLSAVIFDLIFINKNITGINHVHKE